MQVNTIYKQRNRYLLIISVFISLLLALGFVFFILELNKLNKVADYNAQRSAFEENSKKYDLTIEEGKVALENIKMYKYDLMAIKYDLKKQITSILNESIKKRNFKPFDINVKEVEYSKRYYNIVEIQITFVSVHDIFRIKGGKESAFELVKSMLKEKIDLGYMNLYGEFRVLPGDDLLFYFKLKPKNK